jgi:hypothetical protein
MKHLCPGTGVEASGVAMQGNHEIPTWILDGINDPHLQGFLAGLRLYQRIVASKRRRFHGLCFLWLESFQQNFF